MISISMALLLSLAGAQSRGVDSLCASAPFDMPAVTAPVIPSREVNLVDFGGIGDGLTDNTSAFASAIGHLKHLGGGRLTVSDGVWVTGPIELEDNIELHLRDNCMILFSEEKDKYPIVETVFEGVRTYRCKAQLSAVGKKNVAVTGQGIIDGSGDIWRIGRKREMPPEDGRYIKWRRSVVVSERKLFAWSARCRAEHCAMGPYYGRLLEHKGFPASGHGEFPRM